MKILAIDDNQDNLTALQAVLSDRLPEATVLTAQNGPDGLDLAHAEDPDVILLDVVMPGMDGYEVCRRLRADPILKATPVLFLTANQTDRASRVKALEAGAEGFLTKPFDDLELTAQIRTMVRIKAAVCRQRTENERLASLVEERTRALMAELDERRQAQDALQASEARLQDIIANMGGWAWETDENGTCSHMSQKGIDLLGRPLEDILGKTPFDFMAPDEAERVASLFSEIAASKVPIVDLEYWIVRPDGERRDLLTNAFPVLDEGGNLKGYRGVDRDITGRKQAQRFERLSSEVLGILNEPVPFADAIQRTLAAIKRETGVDAVGMRLRDGDDFPYLSQDGFSAEFIEAENALAERDERGDVCRNQNGEICLSCTCGLVISGKTDAGSPLFTEGGSFWTNDSSPLLALSAAEDPRSQPRNRCIHDGYVSVALIPIRTNQEIVGLLHLNGRRGGCFSRRMVQSLEGICTSIGGALMRSRVQEQLRASEEEFRVLVENMQIGLVVHAPDSTVLFANPLASQLLGQTPGEMYGKTAADPTWFFMREDGERMLPVEYPVNRALAGDSVAAQVLGIVRGDGSDTVWVQCSAHSVRDSEGRTRMMIVTFLDITQRRRVEEKLRVSEQSYRNQFAMNSSVMLLIDPADGAILDANAAALAFYGYSLDQLLAMRITDINTLPAPDVLEAMVAVPQEEGGQFQFQHRLADGSLREVDVSASRIQMGERTVLHSIISDITERKRAEEVILRQQYSLEKAQELGQIGSWSLDLRRNELRWTDENCRIFGVAPGSVVNYETFLGKVHPDDRDYVNREWSAALAGKPYDIEHRIFVDGAARWVREKADIEWGEEGKAVAAHGFTQDITERKRSEEALRQSEEINRATFEQAAIGIAHVGLDGTWLRVNDKLCAILGYSPDELMALTFQDITNQDDLGRNLAQMERMLAGEIDSYSMEKRYIRRDRSAVWTNVTVSLVKTESGTLRHFIAVIEDISERKEAERALLQRLDVERLAGQVSSDIALVTVDEIDLGIERALGHIGEFTGADRSYVFQFGDDGALIGNTHEWCAEGIEPQIGELQDISLQEELPWFAERIVDGQVFAVPDVGALPPEAQLEREHFEAQSIRSVIVAPMMIGGKLIGFMGFDSVREQRDWDESDMLQLSLLADSIWRSVAVRKGELALRESEERFQQLFDHMADGVAVYEAVDEGQDFVFVDMNETGQSFSKLLLEDVVGRRVSEVFPGVAEIGLLDVFRRVWRTGQPEHLPLTDYVDDRIELWVENYVYKLPSGLIVAIYSDTTAQKRAEEEADRLQAQLHQAQKMDAIGQLAGGVAHDFNNMLEVIIGNTEFALEDADPAEPLCDDLREVLKAARRSADLTRQLLTFARKQVISPRALDLNEAVEGMLKMLRRLIGENVELDWQTKAGLWPVMMDPSQIDQILANLCVNARDAIADVGAITIRVENTALDEACPSDLPQPAPGEYVVLSVSDNGCGMDEKTVAQVFEPFFTTKGLGEGTGLGLAAVYGIAQQNSGGIDVCSEVGRGTTFTIYLPRHMGAAPAVADEGAMPALHGTETVLLVEDELTILKMVQKMLEKQGYTVLAAPTPAEATRLFSAHVGEIHLLIADVIMPEMNGQDLATRLLSLSPSLKCLLMSGYTADIIARHGVLEEGVNFIQKPFSSRDLGAKVREVLDEKQGGR